MNRLAILGGPKIRSTPYPAHVTTDDQEIPEVLRVLKTGILSAFEGANTAFFLGGPEVRKLEQEWAERFGVRHAVAMNSATSALMASIGALGIGPGDEVLVPPWTMTATATAALVYHALPVFCDIEERSYGLDPRALQRAITPRTKAILAVHLFGHPADMDPILRTAQQHGLAVIEDAAQAPGASYKGRLAGTLGRIGVFSLNCNKIIQCGEGGIAVTDDEELALRLRLIRNHAESAITTGIVVKNLSNMVGWNYRMTELEAAVARVQLRKLDRLLEQRLHLVEVLTKRLQGLPGLRLPTVQPGCTHSYYRYAIRLDLNRIPVPGPIFAQLLNAEGMDFYPGYQPLYLQPIYQKQIAYGEQGCPFRCACGNRTEPVSYARGICPVAEQLQTEVISTEVVRPPLTPAEMEEIARAFEKLLGAGPDALLEAQAVLLEQVPEAQSR